LIIEKRREAAKIAETRKEDLGDLCESIHVFVNSAGG